MKQIEHKPNLHGYDQAFAYTSERLWRRWVLFAAFVFIPVAIVSVPWGVNYGFALGIVLVLFVPFIPPVRRRIRPLSAVGDAMKLFASQNNMRYIEIAKMNYDKHFQPAVSRLGLFERKEQIVSGTFAGYPFETYVYTFRHLFDNRLSRVATRVYRIRLPKELPHIFMRNLQSGNTFVSSVMRHFDDDQRVRLEGNFEDKYTTYTNRRTMTETLSLLAPNVLETLINANKKFDVEIVGNNLYLYCEDYLTNREDLQEALATIERLLKHINHRLVSWKFTLPNKAKYPYLHSRPGFGTVKLGHTHFNKSLVFIAGYTVFSLAKVLADPVWREAKIGLIVTSDLVMITVLLYFRRRYQLSKRTHTPS